MNNGKIFIICGPSGAGKGTLISGAVKNYSENDVFFSVSVTTRSPRPGEKDGVSYHFITREEFDKILESGGLLEYNIYCNTCYGTPKTPVDEALKDGKMVLFDVDINGMRNIKKAYPDAVSVFIMPPSEEILKERLIGRGTETEEQIEKRLLTAKEEIKCKDQCDLTVINDGLQKAVDELTSIFRKFYK